MEYTIKKDFHYFLEGLFAITNILNEEGPRELKEDLSKNYGEDTARELTKDLIPLFEEIKKSIDIKNQKNIFLFSENKELQMPLWIIIGYSFLGSRDITKKELIHTFLDIFDESDLILKINTQNALIDYILKKNLSDQTKADLIYIFLNAEEIYKYLKDLSKSIEVIIKSHLNTLLPKINSAMGFIEEGFIKNGLNNFLKENGISIFLDEKSNCLVYPHIFPSNQAVMIKHLSENDITILFGINVFDIGKLRDKNQFSDKRLQDAFKIISDKTKFDILRLLKNKNMYGSELANEIGLTPSTISYHLSQLTSLNILNIIKDENKIYYGVNKDILEAYFTEFKNKLL